MDAADIEQMGKGCREPVLLIVNPQDVVLKYIYAIGSGENSPALGTDGTVKGLHNVAEYAVSGSVTEETDIDAVWGKSETIKRLCNHLATFYFAELGRVLEGKPSANAQIRVPQGNVNIEAKVLDARLWWEVLDECKGWCLEQNILTKHCRILDTNKIRVAWGSEREMRLSFAKVRVQLGGKN